MNSEVGTAMGENVLAWEIVVGMVLAESLLQEGQRRPRITQILLFV